MSSYSKITYSKTAYHSYDASISNSTWSDLLSGNKSYKLSEIVEISSKDKLVFLVKVLAVLIQTIASMVTMVSSFNHLFPRDQ